MREEREVAKETDVRKKSRRGKVDTLSKKIIVLLPEERDGTALFRIFLAVISASDIAAR